MTSIKTDDLYSFFYTYRIPNPQKQGTQTKTLRVALKELIDPILNISDKKKIDYNEIKNVIDNIVTSIIIQHDTTNPDDEENKNFLKIFNLTKIDWLLFTRQPYSHESLKSLFPFNHNLDEFNIFYDYYNDESNLLYGYILNEDGEIELTKTKQIVEQIFNSPTKNLSLNDYRKYSRWQYLKLIIHLYLVYCKEYLDLFEKRENITNKLNKMFYLKFYILIYLCSFGNFKIKMFHIMYNFIHYKVKYMYTHVMNDEYYIETEPNIINKYYFNILGCDKLDDINKVVKVLFEISDRLNKNVLLDKFQLGLVTSFIDEALYVSDKDTIMNYMNNVINHLLHYVNKKTNRHIIYTPFKDNKESFIKAYPFISPYPDFFYKNEKGSEINTRYWEAKLIFDESYNALERITLSEEDINVIKTAREYMLRTTIFRRHERNNINKLIFDLFKILFRYRYLIYAYMQMLLILLINGLKYKDKVYNVCSELLINEKVFDKFLDVIQSNNKSFTRSKIYLYEGFKKLVNDVKIKLDKNKYKVVPNTPSFVGSMWQEPS